MMVLSGAVKIFLVEVWVSNHELARLDESEEGVDFELLRRSLNINPSAGYPLEITPRAKPMIRE